MKRNNLLWALLILGAFAFTQYAGQMPALAAAKGAKPVTKEQKIQNAMTAAPKAISKEATILDWPEQEGAEPVVIRQGSNDWSCFPDWPVSPNVDPQCYDKPSMEWISAYMKKQEPQLAQDGIAYMLQGGHEPSNTDPFATKPAPGEKWLTTPSHIMVFPSGKLDPKVYGSDPHTGRPWIMFPDTPYAHLMIPVK